MRRLFATAAVLFLLSGPGKAADYRFSVFENVSDVVIREDGGIDISYRLTFTCDPGGRAIDIVDVGLPNKYYELSSAQARINGMPASKIRKSEYVPVGVEVHLGSHEIRPGQTGTLEFSVTNPHMVFPDSQDPNFASMEFSPTYYGSQYATGATRLRVSIHFPNGADDQNVKWHYSQHNWMEQDRDGRLVYVWEIENASPSRQYKFGVSFPKFLVKRTFEPVKQEAYQASGSSAKSLVDNCIGPVFVIGLIVFFIAVGTISERRRKMKYFPPIAAVEGVEIKRGLTAPEAALLLEVPLNKVAAMIIFGLKKKGVIDISTMPKLNVQVINKNVPDLQPYEKSFLDLIGPGGVIPEKGLKPFFIKMINSVRDKLKGFNPEKTRAHYRAIINQAWEQVKNSGTDAEANRILDNSLPWLMMEKNLDGKLKDNLGGRQVSTPTWFYSGSHHGGASIRTGSVDAVQFADQVVSRIEGVANSAVARLEGLTGGVTSITNPPPKSSGGGSGGGCACACAGCACACAGGGR